MLSGVIQTFNLIDNARLHFRDGTRIHGIITDGGQAVNIIPQTAQAMFSVRTYMSAVGSISGPVGDRNTPGDEGAARVQRHA